MPHRFLFIYVHLLFINIFFAHGREKEPPLIGNYWLRDFTDENGLPQNSVKDMILDRSGFLWITTENGVVRFDGRNFQVYNSNYAGQYSRFQNFSRFLNNSPDTFYAISEKDELIKIEKSRALPDITLQNDLLPEILFPEKENITWLNNLQNNFWTPSPSVVYILPVVEKQNTFFRFDRRSIEFYENGKLGWKAAHAIEFFGDFFHLRSNLYYADKAGNIVLRTRSGSSPVTLTGDFTDISPGKQKKVYSNNNMSQVFLYADKNLYLLSQKEPGLLHSRLVLSGIDPQALNIASVLLDTRANRLYMGSFTKGLLVFSKRFFSVLDENVGGTMDNVFYSQAVLDSHTVITPQGSILGMRPSTEIKVFTESPLLKSRMSSDRYSMAKDASGNFWIKNDKTLRLYDPRGEKELASLNLPARISQVKTSETGGLWIGTVDGRLYFKEKETNTPVLFLSLENTDISCMAHEGKNILWLGSGKGLYKVDLPSKKVTAIDALNNFYIRSLYIPKEDEVWITTYEHGFFLLKNGSLTSFPPDKSGHLTSSHCIVEDSLGFFWIPTNKGLFQARKKDLTEFAEKGGKGEVWYKLYHSSGGFRTNEFNGGCEPCAVRLPNGYVSLPSLNGLVWFRPESVRPGLPSGDILIDRVFADDREIYMSSDSLSLTFPPNHLRLNLGIAYYGPEEELHIQYAFVREKSATRLPSEWKTLNEKDMTIHLFNLKPGDYTLFIRTKNGFGTDNYAYKKTDIKIPTIWYQSWWFYSLLAIVTGTWVLFLVRINGQYLKKRNEILENAVKERTSELNTLLKDLKLSKDNLFKQSLVKEQIIASISHDIKTPLRFLNRLNNSLYQKLLTTGDEESLEMCKASYETGKGLDTLITNLLDYVKTNPLKANEVHKEVLNLWELIENKIEYFNLYLSFKEPVIIHNTIEKDSRVLSNFHLLGIIVQNLLDNSLKASSPQEPVNISFIKDKSVLVFHNRGQAIPKNILDWVNNPGATELDSEKRIGVAPHAGIGLMIVKQLSMLLDIRLTATSVLDEGTYFYLKIEKPGES